MNNLKKLLALVLGMALSVSMLTACGSGSSDSEATQINVFAAASMTESLTEIAEAYEAENDGITISFNFDSSGTLKTQIEEGADCDLFISAAQKQMNQLDVNSDAENNPDGLDFVVEDTRGDILKNNVVIVVSDENKAGITSFEDLKAHLEAGDIVMAMGNEDVPVGQYTQKILEYYGLDEADLANSGCISYGSDVKEVTSQVSTGAVDCGIIYQSDAYSAGLEPIATATTEMCGEVIYPAAIMKSAKNADAAQDFLEYIKTSDVAKKAFEKVGFEVL